MEKGLAVQLAADQPEPAAGVGVAAIRSGLKKKKLFLFLYWTKTGYRACEVDTGAPSRAQEPFRLVTNSTLFSARIELELILTQMAHKSVLWVGVGRISSEARISAFLYKDIEQHPQLLFPTSALHT